MPHHYRQILLWISIVFISASCTASPTQRVTAPQIQIESTETAPPSRQATETQASEVWKELDLRYAQVLDATYEVLESSQVQFDVTMVHDDDGESPQFADWWQVEDQSGNVLGKRILTHGHGNLPFTRSATIEIPPHVEIVIIRGHDMLHGFGGQILQLNLITGEKSLLADYP